VQDNKAVKRTLKVVAASFAGAAVTIVVVLASIDLGDPVDTDLADGGALAAAALGAIGFLVALVWWSRASEQPRNPGAMQIGFIIRTAVAELGLLVGILALVTTGSITPALIGLGLFLVSLLLLVLALDRDPGS